MNEIKFRWYDSAAEEMIFSDNLPHEYWIELNSNGLKLMGEGPDSDFGSTGQAVDCEPMQFSGLKDKNNKDIYAGDLVVVLDASDGERMMYGTVKFGQFGYPAFEIYDEQNRTYSEEYNTFTNDNDLLFEVVGNIHEKAGAAS